MILKLQIKNFALIENQSIDFGEGLNIISGETGSGKTILINAINFILGGRADKTFVRTGESFAQVQAVFDVFDNYNVKQVLLEMGIVFEDCLILSRKINLEGKNEIYINGNASSLTMLKRISSVLVDVCGQHEQQILLDVSKHLDLLDNYIGQDIFKLKENLKTEIDKLNEIDNKIKSLCGESGSLEREKDILQFELKELNEAGITIDEENELIAKKEKMANTQKVVNTIKQLSMLLENAEDDKSSTISSISQASKLLFSVDNIETSFNSLAQRLQSVVIELEDINQMSEQILQTYEWSDDDFEKTENRLELIKNLKRKYGGTVENLLKYQQNCIEKLNILENSEYNLSTYNKQKEFQLDIINKICIKLTEIRKDFSLNLEKQILKQLKLLGMPKSIIKIEFSKNEHFNYNGIDDVQFMFSANEGEPLKPLNKVISGGEMSRFMLAFKTVLGSKNLIKTLIFDEVDSGIGGETAYAVGCKLADISQSNQVISITHLAGIGAMADKHFLIQKSVQNGKTTSKIFCVDKLERINELIRLAGGNKTEISMEYVKEILNKAQTYKRSLVA